MFTNAFTKAELKMMRQQTKSHMSALHNWISSAVEASDIDRAKELIIELREYEELYYKINLELEKS